MATENQEKLLEALRDSDSGFNEVILNEVWNDLLEILQNEREETLLNHYLIREKGAEKDFDDSSIIGIIQGLADLNGDAWTDILGSNATNNFWNESVSDAIKHYLKNFKASAGTVIPGTNGQITYGDIWKADAGFKFDGEEWVKPWKNIDKANYIQVRNNDQIVEGVLNNETDLQFTHIQYPSAEKAKDWIRLLMPMYTRHVEIEDLDRNFWVIGQVISGISAYLFDDKSPITEAIENLLREITELWENILYLWAALAMLNRKEYTDIHTEVVYIPNDEQHPYLKYDDFADDSSLPWQDLCTRFEYLKQDYPESNLVIVPVRRMSNYYHNYYSMERYPGIMIYNRNKPNTAEGYNGFRIISFTNDSGQAVVQYTPSTNEDTTTTHSITKGLSDFLTCAKVTNDSVSYFAPASNITSISELEPSKYVAAIRSSVSISPVYDNGVIKINSITINLYDAIGTNVAAAQSDSGYHTSIIGRFERNVPIVEPSGSRENIVPSFIEGSRPTPTKDGDEPVVKTGKLLSGYYLGEIPSSSKKTKQIEYKIHETSVSMPPITTNDTNEYKTYYYDILHSENEIKDANLDILELYKDKVYQGSAKRIELLVATRQFDLYKATSEETSGKKQVSIKATGKEGLGSYYAKRNTRNQLYTREQLDKDKPEEENHFYDETGVTTNYDELNYNNDNQYLLPFCIYSCIDISDKSFATKNKTHNAYYKNKNGISWTDVYDNMRFTGSHGGRIDLGAILVVPGVGDFIYNDYENYKVLPTFKNSGESGDGAYGFWIKGDATEKSTRHVWNNTTTMICRKANDDGVTANNWCIIYIKTYGVYAPAGALDTVDKVKGADKIEHAYKDGEGSGTQSSVKPMVFKTKVHIFLPNGGYETFTRENWYCTNTQTRPSDGIDNFSWHTSQDETSTTGFNIYKNLISLTPDGTTTTSIGGEDYIKLNQTSSFTGYDYNENTETYTNVSRTKTGEEIYDFYNHEFTGRE